MVVKSGVHSFLHRNCDHQIANSVCTIQSQSNLPTSIMGVRYFQKSNVDHIGNTANVFQWKESFQNMNINDVVHIFTRTATSIFNNFIPHEIITCDYRDQFWIDDSIRAMYKTRNTGTGNGMRETREIGGMLYSGECSQTKALFF